MTLLIGCSWAILASLMLAAIIIGVLLKDED